MLLAIIRQEFAVLRATKAVIGDDHVRLAAAATNAVRSRATRRPEIEVCGIAARRSRITSSIMLSTRKRRSQAYCSWTKSNDKRALSFASYIESFNGRMRDELLNESLFFGLDNARSAILEWAQDHNTTRPHSSLGYRTPATFASTLTATGYDAALFGGSAPSPVAQPAPYRISP
jgi:hypothetical protein